MGKLRESADLLEGFRRGDRAALEAVYGEYIDSLCAMLKEGFAIEAAGKRFLFEGYREPWSLEAAAQEVFTRAFSPRARLSYDGLRPYRNYLFTIARNYVVDTFRKRRRSFVPLDDLTEPTRDKIEESLDTRGGPEDVAISREIAGLVSEFVSTLNEMERALFSLRFTRGLSVEVTAREAGVTEYRVKRTEKRIRSRFLRFMKQQGYFEGYRSAKPASMKVTLLALLMGGGG